MLQSKKDRLELWLRTCDAILASLLPCTLAWALGPPTAIPNHAPDWTALVLIALGTVLQFAAFRVAFSARLLLGQRRLFERPRPSSAKRVAVSELKLASPDVRPKHSLETLALGLLVLFVGGCGLVTLIDDLMCGAFLQPPIWLTLQALCVYAFFFYRKSKLFYEYDASTGRLRSVRSLLGLEIITVLAERAEFLTVERKGAPGVFIATEDRRRLPFPAYGFCSRREALRSARHAANLLGMATCDTAGPSLVVPHGLERPTSLPPLPG